ncbi:MON2-like protein [Auxenochlorella protothecoides]|uniref:MON2-like protein n=1 Tax=Auxenochlorella protothecoides TaxID=3075 RepID=A0A087SHI5_AUXPR|nr:MON2-like protein [Auxenochlorella protothecoides]KFM25189.1 MON2-like protein [Auxenochlorella protothecoides]
MNSPSSSTSFVAALEAEYRQLSTEARKTEGFAGLFTSTDHPEIKEAAEKALLRIRSLADVPDANTQLAQCKELFRPLQLAADTRSPRLAGQALATAQKLLANSAASAEGAEAVLGMLTSAARLSDERVQLKCLQTALTLLQSPLHPITSAALGPLLGVCFGFLAAKGFKSTVTTTAAATVRQALALLLSYIREGEVLELLEFVLATSPACFMDILGLQPIVAQTMPDLLRPQLQDHLDAGVAASAFATAHFPTLRAALRCVRTLLGTFHCQLGAGAGPLVQSLLSGLQAGQPNFQRVAVLHAVVLLLGDGPLLAWLGAKYDHDKASRSEPVRSLAEACLLVLESVEKGRDAEDDPLPAAMARALLGRPGSLEPDPGTGAATAAGQRAALAALALEGMSAFAVTLEGLAGGLPAGWDSGEGDAAAGDAAATTLSNAAASDAAVHDTATTEPGAPSADDVLRTLLDSTWKPMLDTLRRLLGAGPLAPPLLQELLKVESGLLLALGRMTDVLLANTQRLQDLWAVFLSHVLEVLAAAQPSARVVVVEALGRHMLLVSLESVYGGEREPEVRRAVLRVLLSTLQRHGERLGGGWGAVFRLLAAVPEARDAAATDLGFQAVQLVAGDFAAGLGAARLRRCLEVAAVYGAQQEDVNVSLTTISLLWNVADLVGRAAPGSEGGAPDGDTGEEAVSPGAGLRLTQEEGDVILELIFSALQASLLEMGRDVLGLASDPRPEVRNSGLRTLFAVVMSQGGRLSRARWEACLWDMLFPLLRHAFHMSVTSSREESGPAALGRSRGETVHLVVHHSHNSEAKQWDETVVLALGGMGRLLRAHLTLIVTLDQGEAGWEEMMVVIESCMAGARKRVALAAVGVLGSLLAAHGGRRDVLGEAAWARAVRAVEVGVEAAANPTCRVPLARCARHPWSDDDASNGGAAAYGLPPVQKAVLAALPAIAPQPDEEELWIDFLATLARLLHPGQILEAARSAADGEQRPEHPVVGRQVSAARLLTEGGVEVQSALSSSFLLQVLEALVRYYTPAPSGVRAATLAATVGCLGACMAVRHTVYDEALWRAAAKAFTSIVPQGLPALVAANDPKLEARAWAALADALELFLLGRGVEFPTTEPTPENGAAHAGGAGMEAATRDPGSIQMASVTSDAHQASNQDAAQQQASAATAAVQSDDPDATAASAASDSELEAAVLDTLTDAILASAPSMPPPTLDRFVAIVDGGVCRPPWLARQLPHAGLGFSQACLRKLYVVAARYGAGGDGSRGGGGDGLRNGEGEEGQLPAAVAALRALLARCDHMVQAAVDAKTLGAEEGAARARYGGPSGQPRLDEVLCMLEVLASLTLDPAVADALLDGADGQLRQLVGVARGCAGRRRGRERTHLLLIYPALVQAVALQEPRLREMVRDVLQLAGAELGLGVAASPRAE